MTAAGSNTYEYDANGNMTGRTVAGTTYTLTYDYENRLTGVSGGGASYTFVYDGDGNRVKLIAPSDTILYIGGYLEKTSTNEKIYYYEGGARVSMRTAGAAYFLLTDQLGSSTVALTSTGSQYGRLLYHPWGSVRYTTGSVPTSYRYTGQIEYATIAGGIMYYGARYYDNSLGRWLSPDSMVPGAGNPQALDRYAYVFNNPLRYTDPSGHFPIIPLLLIAAAAFLLDACSNSQSTTPTVTTAPVDAATTINTIEPSITNANVYISGSSLSTAVGNSSLVSHDHFSGTPTTTTFTPFQGSSMQISGSPNFVWSGSGTSVISLPNSINSTSAQIAAQATIGNLGAGDWLQVIYQNATGNILSDDFQISSVSSDGFMNMSDPNFIINPGDSGGGAFYNGQLVGVTNNIQFDINQNRIPYFTIAPIPSDLYQWVK